MQMQPQTQATFTMPVKSHRLIASDRVERTPVRRSDGTKVGTIERLMIDKISGKVTHAVLSFGGFMGVGIKHIPIAWDRMKYGVALDAYEINLSDEELSRTAQTEEPRSAPAGASDRECDLRQTRIGFAVPGKAISAHQDALHLSVPFAS
jgi:hypothetical protein